MFAAFANQPAIQPSNHPAAHQSGNKICFHIASARMGHRGPIEMLITGRSIWHRAVVKQIRHGITKDPVPFVQPARFAGKSGWNTHPSMTNPPTTPAHTFTLTLDYKGCSGLEKYRLKLNVRCFCQPASHPTIQPSSCSSKWQ